MTFASAETSLSAGQPFHLYRFSHGGGVFMYTNLAEAVTREIDPEDDPYVFQPLAITHGDIVASGTLDKSTISVTVPDDCSIASLYKDDQPQGIMRLTIWQGHVGEDEVKVCGVGRVLKGSFGESDLELHVEPIAASMQRPGLTRNYSLTCVHVLYGSRCKANRAAATTTAEVAAVSGVDVTLTSGWVADALRVKHRGGVFSWTDGSGRTHRRSIEDVTGDVLRLSEFVAGLAVEDSVTVTLGCDHTLADCNALHSNGPNFGGQPQIPLKNPTGLTNIYY